MNVIGLDRAPFDDLLIVFSRHYVFRLGQGHPGRPACLIHKHVVLALLLHYYYQSKMDTKNLCELFGSPPPTTERIVRHVELALKEILVKLKMR